MTQTTPKTKTPSADSHSAISSLRAIFINVLSGTTPRNLWIALSLLIIGLLFTVFITFSIKSEVEASAQREFDFICNEIRINIVDRLETNAQVLLGGAAHFNASKTVSREEWRIFTQRLQVEQHLPGIQGIGFSLLIPHEQLTRHVEEIQNQGFPDYQVRPAGERETYSSIIYLEPFSGRNLRAFGYDMFSEPIRRKAMERARDENSVALSGKVILVQETSQDIQAGSLMYVPVYRHGFPLETVEQRRLAIQGWVYSPYRMTDLMQGTLRGWEVKEKDRQILLQVYDGDVLSRDALLYESQIARNKTLDSINQVFRLVPVDFAGHSWTLRLTKFGGLVSAVAYNSVWFVLLVGTVISLLLFGLTISLLSTRANARRIAENLTSELRDSEGRYRALVSNIPVGVYTMLSTQEGAFAFKYVSPKVAEIFKVSAESFLVDPQVGFKPIHPDDIDALVKLNKERFQQPKDFVWEGRAIINGVIKWIRIASSPEQLENGNILWNGVIADITDRKQIEESLRDSEEKYRVIFNNEIYAICIFDLENLKILDVNNAYTQLYGYGKEELISGMTIHDITAEHQVSDTATKQAINQGTIFIPLRYHKKKDGTVFPVEIVGGPYSWKGKKVMFALAHDITERKRLEADRIKLQNLESLGVFAGGIAHDYNNLLTSIMGNASLVQANLNDEKTEKCISRIIDSSQKATLLTNQLLTFAQGGSPLKKEISIRDTIRNSLELSIERLDVNVDLHFSESLNLNADPDQITQVIRNVINNAKESMPGGGEIIISTSDIIEHEQPFIRIEIKDSGIGIKNENIDKIFDPYFSTKPKGYEKGSGLGLSVAYSIIKKHDGRITVCSEVGKGTTVEILIPAVKHEVIEVIEESKNQERKYFVRKLNVLIMDDEELIREVLSDLLIYLGHVVTQSNEGEEAIKHYKNSIEKNDPYDLVILDLKIVGGMGGKETIKKLREINPNLKAIVSSGYSEGTLSGYKKYGFDAKLNKPYTLKELKEVINQVANELA